MDNTPPHSDVLPARAVLSAPLPAPHRPLPTACTVRPRPLSAVGCSEQVWHWGKVVGGVSALAGSSPLSTLHPLLCVSREVG